MILYYCNWSICFSCSGLLSWSMIPGQQEVVSGTQIFIAAAMLRAWVNSRHSALGVLIKAGMDDSLDFMTGLWP